MKKRMIGLCAVSMMIALTGAAAAETVKIGVIAPFSGAFARWGEQFQQSIAVYQKHNGDWSKATRSKSSIATSADRTRPSRVSSRKN